MICQVAQHLVWYPVPLCFFLSPKFECQDDRPKSKTQLSRITFNNSRCNHTNNVVGHQLQIKSHHLHSPRPLVHCRSLRLWCRLCQRNLNNFIFLFTIFIKIYSIPTHWCCIQLLSAKRAKKKLGRPRVSESSSNQLKLCRWETRQ